MITFHHVWLDIAHLCVPKELSSTCHVSFPAAPDTLSPTSPTYPTFSHPSLLAHDPYLPCDVPRQSGGSAQIPSLTGYELIEPGDLQPRRIELGRNIGTDPYQTQERFMRNSVTEDMDEFGKVGVEMSYIQSQMHSDYDSAESTADSDLEDGE